ncbi:hypothetical protein ACWD4T_12495, partial [Streptomyces umbrinus]
MTPGPTTADRAHASPQKASPQRASPPQTPAQLALPRHALSHLDALESEAVHIFREVAGEFERPVILFSGGKDS